MGKLNICLQMNEQEKIVAYITQRIQKLEMENEELLENYMKMKAELTLLSPCSERGTSSSVSNRHSQLIHLTASTVNIEQKKIACAAAIRAKVMGRPVSYQMNYANQSVYELPPEVNAPEQPDQSLQELSQMSVQSSYMSSQISVPLKREDDVQKMKPIAEVIREVPSNMEFSIYVEDKQPRKTVQAPRVLNEKGVIYRPDFLPKKRNTICLREFSADLVVSQIPKKRFVR
eukprot:TRINITY_DN1040_c0_g1_i1.p1 TRINITY_DN1040_c0_g1~~TRINITY_DN1040_c0_g1_i1.p1  ORF type:complete len:231 (-),score=31.67 TRINITY_DN1040_c0_g1_i1:145-837(-)